MSCYIVSDATLNVVVSGLIKYKFIDYKDGQKVFDEFLLENEKSYNYRYKDSGFTQSGVFKNLLIDCDVDGSLTITCLLKQVKCYMYQACEHPDWESSNVYKLCDELEKMLTNNIINKLLENDMWGLNDEDVYLFNKGLDFENYVYVQK